MRKEHKSPTGGLTQKGRDYFKRKTGALKRQVCHPIDLKISELNLMTAKLTQAVMKINCQNMIKGLTCLLKRNVLNDQ